MVIAHETQVRQHRSEILPSGERRRLDHQPLEVAMLLDVGIRGTSERGEVFGPERALGSENQDPPLAQQLVLNHA